MNLGRLCQIILKSDKEISGYGQLAQHVIFAYHMVRQPPLIALPLLRFNGYSNENAQSTIKRPDKLGDFATKVKQLNSQSDLIWMHVEFCRPVLPHNQLLCLDNFNLSSLQFLIFTISS